MAKYTATYTFTQAIEAEDEAQANEAARSTLTEKFSGIDAESSSFTVALTEQSEAKTGEEPAKEAA